MLGPHPGDSDLMGVGRVRGSRSSLGDPEVRPWWTPSALALRPPWPVLASAARERTGRISELSGGPG